MVVELVFVGTELLLGNILNTNGKYLAERCAFRGLSVYYQTVVGDNEERLKEALTIALGRSDAVIISGGLGPTEDDLTKETAAEVLGLPLAEDAHTRKRIAKYFARTGQKDVPENNWKQALVPEGAVVLDNDNGTAPGLILEKNGKIVVLLPGPPGELIPLFEEKAEPYLCGKQPETIHSAMVKICGVGESRVAEMIRDMISGQDNPTIAPYAKTGEVHLRVTAKAAGEEEAKKLIKPVIKELKSRFGNHIYTVKEKETLEEAVVGLLEKHGLTLTTAESCTGGMLAARLINVPGVSEVYKSGFITYSNKAKRKLLGVNKNTLKKYGAVSEETAHEMAKGCVFETNALAALAVTGIAGPGGGTAEKPVGLVYISCCLDDQVMVKECRFKGDRNKIREQSVVRALDLLRRCILDRYETKK